MNIAAILLQATAIMLALTALRPLLKRVLSAKARCALWLIPALRLLLPFEVRSTFSIMAPAAPLSTRFENAVHQPIEPPTWLGSGIGLQNTGDTAETIMQEAATAAGAPSISLGSILFIVWLIGAAITGGIIIWQNIRFCATVKRLSQPLGKNRGLPVYLVKGLPSPCLAGVIRPNIYINEHALASKDVLEMTIRHERTHYRRLDHIWNAMRGLLLAVYWFHPLVWICSELFRRDCETACDEAATRGMDQAAREQYGMALITLAAGENRSNAGRLVCLSTMSGSKKLLKERITHLAKGRTLRCAALIAALLAIVLCFTMCTMPQENADKQPDTSGSPWRATMDIKIPGDGEPQPPEGYVDPVEAVPFPALGEAGTYTDLGWFLELSAGSGSFTDIDAASAGDILCEYRDLLKGYQLMARISETGTCAYIVGEYGGNSEDSPLWPMYSVDLNGEAQVLYTEAEQGAVEAALSAGEQSMNELPDTTYILKNSRISYSQNSDLILIQPVSSEVSLDSCFSRYTYYPNGRAYLADALDRGIAINKPTSPYLEVYLISELYGEIMERIPLSAEQLDTILAEESEDITEGFGFCAALCHGGETVYYTERTGAPRSVIDLAVEKCGYKFADPSYIKGPVLGATLECSWLTEPLYADGSALERLGEILKNAEFGYVGACGYGAKLTLELTGGEKLTAFKGTDGCDTIVFGSYGGYFLGTEENIEFWEIFGLDPDTKEPAA